MPSHGLGPHVVGRRVVVRRVLPGETGPSGGPAMTDVLGVCEHWGEDVVVRREDGEAVHIPRRDIVAGKPVPPRPSPRMRVSAEEVHHRAMEGLRSRHVEHVGTWVLRATGGTTGRTNSGLAVVDPGIPLDDAVDRVLAFYAEHDRPAWVQVVVGSDVHAELERRGWSRARPDEADSDVLLAPVSRVRRALAQRLPAERPAVTIGDELTRGWLVGNERALASFDSVLHQLQGDFEVAFASVEVDGEQWARGRASYARDWVVVTDLFVHPEHRRSGLSLVVLDALLGWAAELGATTLTLQVLADNEPAQALYAEIGLERHHTYRYLAAP